MTRAALYARYSSDNQRRTSIDDQLRLARQRCEREGWRIVAEHHDAEISAATPVEQRPGSRALVAGALAGAYDVLVLEALDRLARNLGDQERIVERLEYRGIRIVCTSDGYDSALDGREIARGVRGLFNAQYLRDLAKKTHRGQAGQFARGRHVGGVQYGYRSEPTVDGLGRVLAVDAAQAAVVVRIYEAFADGASTRAIAHALNAEGVPAPRGGTWAVSCIQGSAARGLGLLHAEIYRGRQTWNRRRWMKNPDTGRRTYVERPRDEWQVREAPELRIVSDALWQRVCERMRRAGAGVRRNGGKGGRGAAPRTLFGAGALRCAACGAAIVAINAQRYGCSARKDRGPAVCPSGATVKRDALERRLLGVLRDELLAPAALAELQAEVRRLLAQHGKAARTERSTAKARLQALEGEIARVVDAIAAVGISPALQARLAAAERERDELVRLVDAASPGAGAGAPLQINDALARYRRHVLNLQQALAEGAGAEDLTRTREILAAMLGTVLIGRDEATGDDYAELEEPAERLLLTAVGESLGVVAGGRNTTKRRLVIGR
ncbi:MAG TPA: recombinase family protein [Burkholderiaceae bacterium]|nr:recombinase family protein [Burkholderiaceae bacterium]